MIRYALIAAERLRKRKKLKMQWTKRKGKRNTRELECHCYFELSWSVSNESDWISFPFFVSFSFSLMKNTNQLHPSVEEFDFFEVNYESFTSLIHSDFLILFLNISWISFVKATHMHQFNLNWVIATVSKKKLKKTKTRKQTNNRIAVWHFVY